MLLRNIDQNLFIEVNCHFIKENIIYSIIKTTFVISSLWYNKVFDENLVESNQLAYNG